MINECDPIESYLKTGQSVKVVGIFTEKPIKDRKVETKLNKQSNLTRLRPQNEKTDHVNYDNNNENSCCKMVLKQQHQSSSLSDYSIAAAAAGGGGTKNNLSVPFTTSRLMPICIHKYDNNQYCCNDESILSNSRSHGSGTLLDHNCAWKQQQQHELMPLSVLSNSTLLEILSKALVGKEEENKAGTEITFNSATKMNNSGTNEDEEVVVASTDCSTVMRMFLPASFKQRIVLLHSLEAQLLQSRIDAACYVRSAFQLLAHLRYLHNIYLLGQPDYFATIRELCSQLCDSRSSSAAQQYSTILFNTNFSTAIGIHRKNKNSFQQQTEASSASTTTTSVLTTRTINDTNYLFIGERISSAMMEQIPNITIGCRDSNKYAHCSNNSNSINNNSCIRHLSVTVSSSSSSQYLLKSASEDVATSIHSLLNSYRSNASLDAVSYQCHQPKRSSGSAEAIDERHLIALVSDITVEILLRQPISQFVDTADDLSLLNNHLRFLLLITTSRWYAEYWWKRSNSKSFIISRSQKQQQQQQQHILSSLTPSSTDNELKLTSSNIIADITLCKRRCQAGLAIWLHATTTLSKIFLAHLNSTLWLQFELEFERHKSSLMMMKRAYKDLLFDISTSINLLPLEDILAILEHGFTAAYALRYAVDIEMHHHHQQQLIQKAKENEVSSSHRNTTTTTLQYNMRQSSSSSSSVESIKLDSVLLAYKGAENSFTNLKTAIEILKNDIITAINCAGGVADANIILLQEFLLSFS